MILKVITKFKLMIKILKLEKMDLEDLENKLSSLEEFHFRFQLLNNDLPNAQQFIKNQKEEIELLEKIIIKKEKGCDEKVIDKIFKNLNNNPVTRFIYNVYLLSKGDSNE